MSTTIIILVTGCLCGVVSQVTSEETCLFEGKHYSGRGDTSYIQLLEYARRMLEPDPEFQHLAMLYTPDWNGFVEGPIWNAWWIQNSYGTTFCALPFLLEPYLTFLQNSQDLWFDQMGDGKRAGDRGFVAPDGCLCDAAAPGIIYYKQGDGRVDIHDWGYEFTAAGIIMQAELLLISRDEIAIQKYLPKLERCAAFIYSRRDPNTNLFLVGPAANLLAPSYAGWHRPDGTFDKAYLAGLSITYLAALDRLIELEKLVGNENKVQEYEEQREQIRKGLPLVTTEEGYFIKSLDPDGTKHGVYGAPKHGYFEASPNHDAIAFRIVDDAQAERIYQKIASIPDLRRHAVIIANEPSLDDMYETPDHSIWVHGHWGNGGHWSTCEARMILAYYRLGKFNDVRQSFEHILKFARQFRMDNPLTDFGNNVYQPHLPINICYDTFGPAAALLRGLFEYRYTADALILIPHIPENIHELHQHDPVRFGTKRIYISIRGNGPIRKVLVNGQSWTNHSETIITLPYHELPSVARIAIGCGEEQPPHQRITPNTPLERITKTYNLIKKLRPSVIRKPQLIPLLDIADKTQVYARILARNENENPYLISHARLIMDSILVTLEREKLLRLKKLPLLNEESQKAADQSYLDTVLKLWEGFNKELQKQGISSAHRK